MTIFIAENLFEDIVIRRGNDLACNLTDKAHLVRFVCIEKLQEGFRLLQAASVVQGQAQIHLASSLGEAVELVVALVRPVEPVGQVE